MHRGAGLMAEEMIRTYIVRRLLQIQQVCGEGTPVDRRLTAYPVDLRPVAGGHHHAFGEEEVPQFRQRPAGLLGGEPHAFAHVDCSGVVTDSYGEEVHPAARAVYLKA